MQGAGSQVAPGTASTSQQADNTGDNQGSQAVAASTSPPAGSKDGTKQPQNLIDLDSPATTPSPASHEIPGLMATLDINN